MSSPRPEVGDRVPAAEQLVTAALRAFELQEWHALVGLTEMDSVVTLKTKWLAAKIQLQRSASDAKPADWDKLTWDAQQAFSRADTAIDNLMNADGRPITELAGIHSLEDAAALVPTEFLTRWAQARHSAHLVDGKSWDNHDHFPPRSVVGSVAVSPDKVAVAVQQTNTYSVDTLGALSLVAVVDSGGVWRLDASHHWF